MSKLPSGTGGDSCLEVFRQQQQYAGLLPGQSPGVGLLCMPSYSVEKQMNLEPYRVISQRNFSQGSVKNEDWRKAIACTRRKVPLPSQNLIHLADQGKPTDVIFLDFHKAFHIVSHRILMDKMFSTQLDKDIMQWVSNWLMGQAQRVIVNGVTSDY
ncbi:hypothetical protein BTVI_31935 [Pitangus sulphuratus]|nr:hypothetical protein BTVI_31935 [Pitangus sulphuratus]